MSVDCVVCFDCDDDAGLGSGFDFELVVVFYCGVHVDSALVSIIGFDFVLVWSRLLF